jgi:hypothetical protein
MTDSDGIKSSREQADTLHAVDLETEYRTNKPNKQSQHVIHANERCRNTP